MGDVSASPDSRRDSVDMTGAMGLKTTGSSPRNSATLSLARRNGNSLPMAASLTIIHITYTCDELHYIYSRLNSSSGTSGN